MLRPLVLEVETLGSRYPRLVTTILDASKLR